MMLGGYFYLFVETVTLKKQDENSLEIEAIRNSQVLESG